MGGWGNGLRIYESPIAWRKEQRIFIVACIERIHELNLLCDASLKDDELRIAMREVDNENPNEMYNQAKRSLKKYYGSSSISNQTKAAATSSVQTALIKKTLQTKITLQRHKK